MTDQFVQCIVSSNVLSNGQNLTGGMSPSFLLSLLVYPLVIYMLVWMTITNAHQEIPAGGND